MNSWRSHGDDTARRAAVQASVVICTYTTIRYQQLAAACESVRRQTVPAHELIVVIDHCPELLERAVELGADVRLIANSESRGLSGARNTGLRAATGDVVAFLDDDAEADQGWLEHLLQPYSDSVVVGVGGLVVPRWTGDSPRWLSPEFHWVVGCSYRGLPTITAQVRNPIGANMSFRRSALLDVGGFTTGIGRIGTKPVGCEETELSIRLVHRFPGARILYEPTAVVHHHVPADRTSWAYYRRRCWAEGQSKADVSRLSDPRNALGAERAYVRHTLPVGVLRELSTTARRGDLGGLTQAAAICAGLAITTTGYLAGRRRSLHKRTSGQGESMMPQSTIRDSGWLHFDVHGRVGMRVAADAPAVAQLRTMLACFAATTEVPADIVVNAPMEPIAEEAVLEDELAYTQHSLRFVRERVQIVRERGQFRIHGPGELLTAVVPVLDHAMTERGAGMIHAATVAYRGHAIALPAAGGTGKTSTVAKLMKREGFSFMGDDWAFLADDGTLLGYEKPMFIKPHHRDIYPHLFTGARKPLVPVSMSRSVGRLTTVIHPYIVRYPRLADASRRWSPEHRMVRASQALPGTPITRAAPLLAVVYIERYGGAQTRLFDREESWMVDRMLGNFHIEMAGFSRDVVAAMGATSVAPWRRHIEEKATVLTKALDGRPCYLLQVPNSYKPDQASDDVVRVLEEILPTLLDGGDA